MPQYEYGPRLAGHLKQQHGEIIANFQVNRVPAGSAPLAIKQAWLHEGMLLPVREKPLPGFPYYVGPDALELALEDYEDKTVTVSGGDAVLALKNAGEDEAVSYWVKRLGKNALISPMFFHGYEGILTPVEQSTRVTSLEKLVDAPSVTAAQSPSELSESHR